MGAPGGSEKPRGFNVRAHPGASSPALSKRMSGLARKNTAPEMALRRALHARGLRYRVVYPVPGNRRRTIDIAFTRRKVAVFVDGCFWHGCPVHGRPVLANSGWWAEKLAANRARDADTTVWLSARGWSVLRVWECTPVEDAAADVVALLASEGPPS